MFDFKVIKMRKFALKLMLIVFLITLTFFSCGFLGIGMTLTSITDKYGNIIFPSNLSLNLGRYSNGEIKIQEEMDDFKQQFQNFLYQCINANLGDELISAVKIELQKIGVVPVSSYVRRNSQIQTLEKYLAEEAHKSVLSENGGEWVANLNKKRVDKILNIILNNIGEDAKNFKLTLLDTGKVNAFSTADGQIYLTRGIVTRFTDDELAFVIAHEVYHILSGHWVNWWSDERLFSWSGIDEEYYPGVIDFINFGIDSFSGQATTSYEQEFEADAFAMYVAAKCGYKIKSAESIMSSLPSLPVSSHPSLEERIKNIEKVSLVTNSPEMIDKFNPVEVALNKIKFVLSNNIDYVESDCTLGVIQGIQNVDTGFSLLYKNVKLIADKGVKGIDDIGSIYDVMEDRLIGRSLMLSSDICVVEIGMDTSLGRSTSGTVGEKLGRIWLIRVNDLWEPIAVHGELGPVSQYRNNIEDELLLLSYDEKDFIRNEVLDMLRTWRDTFCADFKIHIDNYSDLWQTEADEVDDFEEIESIDGNYEIIVWSWFMNKFNRSFMPIHDLQCTIFSPNTVVVRFAFTFKIGDLSIYSGNARLIVAKSRVSQDPNRLYDEYEPDWKIAQAIIS